MNRSSPYILLVILVGIGFIISIQLLTMSTEDQTVNSLDEMTELQNSCNYLNNALQQYQDNHKSHIRNMNSEVAALKESINALQETIVGFSKENNLSFNTRVKEEILPSKDSHQANGSVKNEPVWISLFDKDIAHALVVEALTPFHNGVQPLLKETESRLKKARMQHNISSNRISTPYTSDGILTYDEWNIVKEDLALVDGQYSDDRISIIESFINGLSKLTPRCKNDNGE